MDDFPDDTERPPQFPSPDEPAADEMNLVAECLMRVQAILVSGGYRYVDGHVPTWPLSPVLMAKDGLLMVGSLLGDPTSALGLAVRQMEALIEQGVKLNGAMLVGSTDVPPEVVEHLYRTCGASVACLNAAEGTFQARRKPQILSTVPRVLRDRGLRTFLDPAPSAPADAAECRRLLAEALREQHEVRQFHADRAASGGVGRPYATGAILVVCIAVFVVMAVRGVNVMNPTIPDLLAWGASFGPLIKAGQWWRLITSMFLHIGLIHIAFNMYAAWIFGRVLERFQGTWRMLAFFLFGGLAGGVTSLWWRPEAVSAGASGGLFGVVGGMIALYVRYWRDLPPPLRRGLRSWVVTLLVYNAVFLVAPGIDGAAHVGGLVGGLLMGLAVARSPAAPARPGLFSLVAAVALLAALAIAADYAIRHVPG